MNALRGGQMKVFHSRCDCLRLAILALLLFAFVMTPLTALAGGKPPGKPLTKPGPHLNMALTSSGAVRGNAGFAANSLPANDDGSTGLVPIGFPVTFGAQTWTDLYVNNNGNVTFGSSMWTYTPYSIGSSMLPVIAPFFADVDTRPSGSPLVTYGPDTIDGHPAFGVNYINVGYYSYHMDKLNSFQVILIDRSDIAIGDFDIEFNYDSMTWETGDASSGTNGFGGTPARAGYSDATGSSNGWLELAGSGISLALLDGGSNALASGSLNSGQPGRYIFHIRNAPTTAIKLLDENPANLGGIVTSAAADGATQVRVRCESPTPGVVALAFDGEGAYGTLAPAPGSVGGLGNLTLQLVGTQYQADAIYTVPEGLVAEATHDIHFSGVYTPETGEPQTLEPQTLQLRRPPVILAHGLWSSRDTWAESGARGFLESANFQVFLFDYRDTNAAHFSVNARRLFDFIDEQLRTLRTNREAVARVDVVCHSMGGDISRTLANDPLYFANNFDKGMIRRLVTLGTPHWGSPWANLLWTLHNSLFGGMWDRVMAYFGKPINRGAVEDLRQGSDALQAMGPTAIPSFALIGNIDPAVLVEGTWIDVFYNALRFFGVEISGLDTSSRASLVNSLMNSQSNDGIVLGTSQRGGLEDLYTQRTDNLFHTGEPGSPEMGGTASNLLQGAVSALAPGFPAPVSLAAKSKLRGPVKSKVLTQSDTPLVTITSPPPDSVFHPGDPITITAEPVAGVNVQSTLIIIGDGSGHSSLVQAAPFTATFNIANNFVGTLTFTVAARDDTGALSFTDGTATVQSLATLESIAVIPSPIVFYSVGTTRQLIVTGDYSDDVQRNISDPAVGTTYSSNNSGVASVDANGLVTAVGPGNTLITIANGSVHTQAVAQVTLAPPNVVSLNPTTILAGSGPQTLTIQGMYLGGATAIQFLIGTEPDTLITAENIVVDELGQTLTATVTAPEAATAGPRTVVVTTPGGTSSTVVEAGNQLVIKANQTIGALTFNPTSIMMTENSAVSATASSGLPVEFSSLTPAVCTVSGNTVTGVAKGTCTIAANQAGNAYYNPAPQTTGNLSVAGPAFTGTPVTGKTPLKAVFTDASTVTTGTIKQWLWNFGDGKTSKMKNNKPVKHTYAKPGIYDVTLTITTATGANYTVTANDYISAYQVPKANFTRKPPSGKAPLTVNFTNKSTGSITGFTWNFGDGATSTDINPSHTYNAVGKYTVSLTAVGPVGTSVKTLKNAVNVKP